MKLLHIPQFGPAWHAWRRTVLGGSDATILSGTPVPWTDPPTPLSIWKIKTGRAEPQESTFAMRRGMRLEPLIRAAFLAKTGLDSARPWCVAHETHDWLGSSLDGLDPWGEWIAEFKAPNLKAHRAALEGQVPDYYVPQVQHQLYVTGAQLCYYVSYSENNEIAEADRVAVIEVRPDPALIRRLLLIEHTFWGHVLFDIEPLSVSASFSCAINEEEKEADKRQDTKKAAKIRQDGDVLLGQLDLASPGGGVSSVRKLRDALGWSGDRIAQAIAFLQQQGLIKDAETTAIIGGGAVRIVDAICRCGSPDGGVHGEHSGAGSQPENPDRAERTDDRSGAA